jgi:ribosomal protein L11 methyltransferase
VTPSGWHLALSVPAAAIELFERALARLGGALVSGGRDREGRVPLSVYLAAPPSRAEVTILLAAAAAAAGTSVPGFGIEPLPDLDWVAESEKALPPIRAGRFYVYGAHVTAPPPAAAIAIRIEASVAFGTGRHESTRGCLLMLDRLARRGRVARPLDLGCGSGILAIAMARLGPAPVLAADIDPDSVAKARENAAVNRVARRVRVLQSDGYRGREIARRGPYDLVVANILAGPLAAMAPDLRRVLAPGGRAVLSGLLAAQERQVLAPHRSLGLVLEARLRLGDWTTLLLRG